MLAAFAKRGGITFPLLSDEGSRTIREYGILNTVAEDGLGPDAEDPEVQAAVAQYVSVFGAIPLVVGTPFPGTFIVDAEGRVTSRFFESFYKERRSAADIMLRLGAETNPVSGVRGSTAHLTVTASQSNPEVSAGTRFALILDVEPQPGMHLYAPGADDLGYRVVSLDLQPSPYVRLLPLAYPASEIYHFEPLDERVPVYQRPFRLIQEIVIDATGDAEAALRDLDVIALSGTLDYQACDDRICFDPVSVPLSWSVALAPLDRQRALDGR